MFFTCASSTSVSLLLRLLFRGVTKTVGAVLVAHGRGRGARRAAVGIKQRHWQVEAEAETNPGCFLLPLLIVRTVTPSIPIFLKKNCNPCGFHVRLDGISYADKEHSVWAELARVGEDCVL